MGKAGGSGASGRGGNSGGSGLMESRLRAAAEGQPPIVREALYSGVSVLRESLTKKERGQLARAKRKGLLAYAASDMFQRTLSASPKVLFGG